jgi:hypothetical protein
MIEKTNKDGHTAGAILTQEEQKQFSLKKAKEQREAANKSTK